MSQSNPVREYCQRRGYSSAVVNGAEAYLLKRWRETVRSLAAGRVPLFDEYLDDMDTRRILHEVLPLLSAERRMQVEMELKELDAMFNSITIAVEKCIWGEGAPAKYGWSPDCEWWYYREPRIGFLR